MSRRESQLRLQKLAERVIRKSSEPDRHKCFVSYHVTDEDEVAAFLEAYGTVFIPTVVGITEDDDFVDSEDTDYIMDRIREEYLTDSTVTIVMVGRCTWARRFVDWEVYSSLRSYEDYPPSGLMAITLPSMASGPKRPPDRVNDNVDSGYARWKKYPDSAEDLQRYIQTAFDLRTEKTELIDNSRARKGYNSTCP